MQGVVQEILATKRYGPEKARFEQLKALNGVQSTVCFVWALLLVLLTTKREAWAQLPPLWRYWKAAITNSIGPACGFEALKNISYPAQVRGSPQKKRAEKKGLQLLSWAAQLTCACQLPAA